MSTGRSPKSFALLVGIDRYKNNGTRKDDHGDPLPSSHLRGCVNDVDIIAKLLKARLHSPEIDIMTSSTSTKVEPTKSLPNFANIKQYFENLRKVAKAGDMFFFYFSGHGGTLKRVRHSPHSEDQALLTCDYFMGKPAIRGWQLNQWLHALHDQKIQIVVILDSCHSGESWRGELNPQTGGRSGRTNGHSSIPNLPGDEVAAHEKPKSQNERNAKLKHSWSINPDKFSLMAACAAHELAQEDEFNGVPHGVFTYELVKCFEGNLAGGTLTYRSLCTRITDRIKERNIFTQTPQTHGQDRLGFLKPKERIGPALIFTSRSGHTIHLPVGSAHGVHAGTEFVDHTALHGARWHAQDVQRFKCTIRPGGSNPHERPSPAGVIAARWSLQSQPLWVEVNSLSNVPGTHDAFSTRLKSDLTHHLSGSIHVVHGSSHAHPHPDSFVLTHFQNGQVEIRGPKPLVGYSGAIRGLEIHGRTDAETAGHAAAVLAHLVRFGQVLELAAAFPPPSAPDPVFRTALLTEDGDPIVAPVREGQLLTYVFENRSSAALYLAVLNVAPGFAVAQLYPRNAVATLVPAGKTVTLRNCEVTLPEHLHSRASHGGGGGGGGGGGASRGPPEQHREIFRTVVTGTLVGSWEITELPEISAHSYEVAKPVVAASRRRRNIHMLEEDDEIEARETEMAPGGCWIQDIVFETIGGDD